MSFDGHIDFYGSFPGVAGTFFGGWSSPWQLSGEPIALTGRFERGSVTTFDDYLVTFFSREDLGERGSGFLLFLKGKMADLGEFVSLKLDFDGSIAEITPIPRPAAIHADHLRSELGALLDRAAADPAATAIRALVASVVPSASSSGVTNLSKRQNLGVPKRANRIDPSTVARKAESSSTAHRLGVDENMKNQVLPIPEWFEESAYLSANPDIRTAVETGVFQSGYHHYIQFGIPEGRSLAPDNETDSRAVGVVETVNESVIAGWARTTRFDKVGLFVDNACVDTQEPWLERLDLIQAGRAWGKGFKFHVPRLGLKPGHYTVQVRPFVSEKVFAPLIGNGIETSAFDLLVPDDPLFASPSTIEYLTKRFSNQPNIRRALVADPIIRYRPLDWSGDIIFVDAIPHGPSSRYRVGNLVSELVKSGYDCCVLFEDELWRIIDRRYSARAIHFCRAPLRREYEAAVSAARSNGALIGYDIDDLSFDPRVMPYIDGLRFLDSNGIEEYRRGMLEYQAFIRTADYITCTTNFLASELKKYNPRVSVVPNSLPQSSPIKSTKSSSPVIGYYAGTKTHQADFQVVANAVVRTLKKNPNVALRVVGELELSEFPMLGTVSSQIVSIPAMTYEQMLEDMAKCTIAIAPLEIGNPFCEAKSELKFFEGALTGCAVVASATSTFAEAIGNEETGFLAATSAEWERHLRTLIGEPDRASQVADAAWRAVSSKYSARSAAAALLDAVGLTNESHKLPIATRRGHKKIKIRPGNPRNIAFVVPEILIGAGGHRKIFCICHDLELLGHTVTVYVLGKRSGAENKEIINRDYYPLTADIFRYNGSIGLHDVIVATAWDTAYVAKKHRDCAGHTVYFVQDYEPMFMAVGSEYLRAFATYNFGFQTICLGNWVARRLKRELNLDARVIPFPLNKDVYKPGPKQSKGSRVLAFARTSQERRAFDLVKDALALLSKREADVHIALFGEMEYPPLPFEYENRGVVLDQRELAQLYRDATVGVCFSPTNPSLVGYEMIACGAGLVDLDLPDALANFDGLDIPFLAAPTPEGIAEQIAEALHNEPLRQRRVAAGIEYGNSMIDESEMAELFWDYVTNKRDDVSRISKVLEREAV